MDKRDVEREDTIKQPQDLENGGLQLQKDLVDRKVEDDGKELPHSAAGEDSKPTEVGAEEQNKGKSDDMADQNSTKSEVEVFKITESVSENPNNVKSEGVKEAEDPNNVRSEGIKEAEDPNNVKSEGVKEAEDPNNVKCEEEKAAEDVNNVTSDTKSEAEDIHKFKSEAEHQSKIGSEANEENACENGEQDGNSGEDTVDDQKHSGSAVLEKNSSEEGQHPVELAANEAPQNETGLADEVHQSKDEAMTDAVHPTDNEELVDEPKESYNKTASGTAATDGDSEMGELQKTNTEVNNTDQNVNEEMVNVAKDPEQKIVPASAVADGNVEMRTAPVTKCEVGDTSVANHHEPATPTALVKCATAKAGNHSGETYKNVFYESKMPGDEDGTPEEQATFMRELESFYRERAMEFKPPRFYGQQLNCLKLWRSVIRLGGYDRVTGSKLWRQVGESFHPPKTCTTVSWTFRIFYEKALLEYERYTRERGELPLPLALPDPSSVDGEGNGYQASGSGRARRDAAARAMQGWHAQRLFAHGEAGEPIIKDKNFNNMPKREKNLKSIGSLKQKRPNEVEHPVKAARTETSKQLVASVVDVGPPADWVKINVRETKECFEVYALVPGLLREEVRVQSDPAGRLVITGQPEQTDNPWGITAFKKVVSLPGRIDPLQTSAVVSLHGRLLVRVPFEQSNI